MEESPFNVNGRLFASSLVLDSSWLLRKDKRDMMITISPKSRKIDWVSKVRSDQVRSNQAETNAHHLVVEQNGTFLMNMFFDRCVY